MLTLPVAVQSGVITVTATHARSTCKLTGRVCAYRNMIRIRIGAQSDPYMEGTVIAVSLPLQAITEVCKLVVLRRRQIGIDS